MSAQILCDKCKMVVPEGQPRAVFYTKVNPTEEEMKKGEYEKWQHIDLCASCLSLFNSFLAIVPQSPVPPAPQVAANPVSGQQQTNGNVASQPVNATQQPVNQAPVQQ